MDGRERAAWSAACLGRRSPHRDPITTKATGECIKEQAEERTL